ncbi:MAG: hypothetical protein ACE5G6_00220 [Terriglobia bacterium]
MVEWFAAPASFRDALVFQGHFYLCAESGLFEYDEKGVLVARYLVGSELPAAPQVRLAAGIAPDGDAPELFIATAGEGLLIFDGNRFRQIRPEESAYRKLTSVLPLSTGRVLLGTEKKGVLVFDGKKLAPFHPLLSEVHVTALAGDESNLWVGTLNQGVLHWQAGQVRRFGEEEGLPDRQVLSLAVAGENTYVGTPLGVAEFRGGRFRRVLASGFFAQALLPREENLHIGTLDEGVVQVPLRVKPPPSLRPPGGLPPARVQQLLEVEGRVYALGEEGLYSLEDGEGGMRLIIQREGALLADGNISALAVDAEGKLWVGYFDRGLDIIDLGTHRARHVENDHVFCINRIVPDPDRRLTAVATANGLVLFDVTGAQRQVLGRSEGLIADHVTDVVLDAGAMVVATPAGLTFVDAAGTRSLYAFHGLVNNHAYALASSGDVLLAGTLGGLSVLDGDVVRESYTTANSGLAHNWITAIVSVGPDWFVGTYGAGILRLESNGRWHSFPDATGSFEVNPNAMVATDHRVYAGTLGQGLYVYERSTGRWATLTAGLPSANVTALVVYDGYLYVGTDNGLVRIPERNIP